MVKTTVKDVARKSGFSPATVSRALNNNYPVKKETKEKIQKAVDELNYTRNANARNLRVKNSDIIALVVADINNPYFSRIAKYLGDGLFEKGYSLIVCNTNESVDKEKQVLNTLVSKGVRAIVMSSVLTDLNFIHQLQKKDIKIVLLDRNIELLDIPFVGSANFDETKRLTEYLLKNGHENIIFVAGPKQTVTSQERFQGFYSTILESGLDFEKNCKILQGNYTGEQAYKTTIEFLKKDFSKNAKYTALISSNNLMTAGILEATQRLNIKVPEDLSIVSFGKIEGQELIKPKITCISQDVNAIAQQTLSKLLEVINSDPRETIKSVFIHDNFIEGDSVRKIL